MAPNNLFPCDITLPDGQTFETVRVMVAPTGTTIWGWSRAARSGVILVQTATAIVENGHNEWILDDPTGEVRIAKRNHCACSHPMKHWVPPGPHYVGT